MNRSIARALAFAALALAPRSALATPPGPNAVTVFVAPGIHADRVPTRCGRHAVYLCWTWQLIGPRGPLPLPLSVLGANMFAGARGGRIVAATDNGFFYSDDGGGQWTQAAPWGGTAAPRSLAFDAGSEFGAAVGPNGALWTTDDRGAIWRLVHEGWGPALVDVAVVGRVVAWTDASGAVSVSTDGGASPRTLAGPAASTLPTLTVAGDAIWIALDGATRWRLTRDGTIEGL